jgi:lipopolysaccharide biosynthesis protein
MHGELRVAIAIHGFYMDAFDEILDLSQALPTQYKLFVTTVPRHEAVVRARLDAAGRDYSLGVFENRGRDVLPFLCMFRDVRAEGFDVVVKVHTKKSPHLRDGDSWRRMLVSALLQPQALQRLTSAFAADPSLGIVGPEGHFLSLARYMGGNEARVLAIARRLGLERPQLLDAGYCAGTMFMARTDVIAPLVDLGFTAGDFEAEANQIDGTMAHAFERCLGLGAVALRRRIASSADPFGYADFNDRYAFARQLRGPPFSARLNFSFKVARDNVGSALRRMLSRSGE